jgi:hypothetical protein
MCFGACAPIRAWAGAADRFMRSIAPLQEWGSPRRQPHRREDGKIRFRARPQSGPPVLIVGSTPEVRREYRSILVMAGRWLAVSQPGIASPADWTRETCAAWVAQVTRTSIGDFAQRRAGLADRLGRRLAHSTMASYTTVTRTFFRDCQEWGWCPRRFDPKTALATPRSVRALLGPKPRVIADDAWAKILWAGLNLVADDLAAAGIRAYPLELVNALALTWLFAAQRSDEIVRLRVGCIRWQRGDGDPSSEPVCLLDIPVHKTGAAFTKPVDPVLGRAIEAWEAVRPAQPCMTDRTLQGNPQEGMELRGSNSSPKKTSKASCRAESRRGVAFSKLIGKKLVHPHRAIASLLSRSLRS